MAVVSEDGAKRRGEFLYNAGRGTNFVDTECWVEAAEGIRGIVRILLISTANNAGSIVPLPLGLACVAAATERAGHHVRLLALGSDADCENDVRKAIKQFAPDVIGVSVRNIDDQSMQLPHFLSVA